MQETLLVDLSSDKNSNVFFRAVSYLLLNQSTGTDMPIRKFIAGAMQQTISAAIILVAAGFGYVALTGGLDRMNDTSTTGVGLGIILIWLLIIIGRTARLTVTAKHKKPIEKSNIVALAVAILGAVMFFSSHGVILGTNIQFVNIWIAIIGAVVVAIQWVDDYFKQQRLKEFGQ
jgi:hypothetical protein